MLETLPEVVHAKLAVVEVVDAGGPLVSVTVGAAGGGGGGGPPPPDPESSKVPNSCDQ